MADTTELADKAKAMLTDLANAAARTLNELADRHGDTVTDTVSKAADYVDEKSGGKTAPVTTSVKDFTASTVDAARSATSETSEEKPAAS